MPATGVLALDLATNVGWALWQPGCEIESGSKRLPSTGKDVGKFIDAYQNWLLSFLGNQASQTSHIVYESPLMPSTTRIETLRKLYGLAAHTEWLALNQGKRYYEVNNTTVRKILCGRARAKVPKETTANERKKANKQMVLATCRNMGGRPENDDEADAYLCLAYALRILKLEDNGTCNSTSSSPTAATSKPIASTDLFTLMS